jgi:hypothetical protein
VNAGVPLIITQQSGDYVRVVGGSTMTRRRPRLSPSWGHSGRAQVDRAPARRSLSTDVYTPPCFVVSSWTITTGVSRRGRRQTATVQRRRRYFAFNVGIPDADLVPEMGILLVGRAVHHRSLGRWRSSRSGGTREGSGTPGRKPTINLYCIREVSASTNG